jgi:ABC-type antimicrobial peptide transport system permease subunit
VIVQACISIALGFVLGLALTVGLAILAPFVASNIALDIRAASLLKVGGVSLAIAGLSALLPIWQIARLDPAQVFKGR